MGCAAADHAALVVHFFFFILLTESSVCCFPPLVTLHFLFPCFPEVGIYSVPRPHLQSALRPVIGTVVILRSRPFSHRLSPLRPVLSIVLITRSHPLSPLLPKVNIRPIFVPHFCSPEQIKWCSRHILSATFCLRGPKTELSSPLVYYCCYRAMTSLPTWTDWGRSLRWSVHQGLRYYWWIWCCCMCSCSLGFFTCCTSISSLCSSTETFPSWHDWYVFWIIQRQIIRSSVSTEIMHVLSR